MLQRITKNILGLKGNNTITQILDELETRKGEQDQTLNKNIDY